MDTHSSAQPGALILTWTDAGGQLRREKFSANVLIGRASTADLVLDNDSVSRRHAELFVHENRWWVRDLRSSNGTLLNGQRIETAVIAQHAVLQIGSDGPQLRILLEAPASPVRGTESPPDAQERTRILPMRHTASRPLSQAAQADRRPDQAPRLGETPPPNDPQAIDPQAIDPHAGPAMPPGQPTRHQTPQRSTPMSKKEIAARYLEGKGGDASEFTQAFRLVYKEQQRKQRRWHVGSMIGVIALATILLAGSGIHLLWQQQRLDEARLMAIDLFYDIKSLELDLVRLQERVQDSEDRALVAQLEANTKKLEQMSDRYDEYLEQQLAARRKVDQKELTILRVARLFGECELNMPESFHDEVKNYIKKWQATGRLKRAIERAKQNGYTEIVRKAMLENDLPPQFFYLGLQESNFNPRAVGPPTRYGIAKGAWQFIPATAERFGLKVGPLAEEPVYDPEDQRFDFTAAANAAARYLKSIYDTDAQASALLVMASYNWGEGNIIKRIRSMPKNPRERNFWSLVNKYKIPDETYNYVLYIFSATVIGEKPELFGFDFDSPL